MVRRDRRLGRDDWLVQALEVLQAEGIRGVRVERLARDLGVTKGSFYWHFKSRDDLFASLLDHWARVWTASVIDEARGLELPPREKLERLLEQVTRRRMGRYDLAVRAWAAFDERAAETVRRVDACRLEFMEEVLRDMGFVGDQLAMRARAILYYQTAELSMRLGDTADDRLRLLPPRVELMTTP